MSYGGIHKIIPPFLRKEKPKKRYDVQVGKHYLLKDEYGWGGQIPFQVIQIDPDGRIHTSHLGNINSNSHVDDFETRIRYEVIPPLNHSTQFNL